MYKLYHNKNGLEIEISKVKDFQKWFLEIPCTGNEVVRYNDCYYVSNNRKALNELAKKMKEEWIKDKETLLEQYSNMEIKKKYS